MHKLIPLGILTAVIAFSLVYFPSLLIQPDSGTHGLVVPEKNPYDPVIVPALVLLTGILAVALSYFIIKRNF
jgi:hypothetical protein